MNRPICWRCGLEMKFTRHGEWACLTEGAPDGTGGGCFHRFRPRPIGGRSNVGGRSRPPIGRRNAGVGVGILDGATPAPIQDRQDGEGVRIGNEDDESAGG